MAINPLIWSTLPLAALLCLASAALFDVRTDRNIRQSAANAKHHPGGIAKRSFYVRSEKALYVHWSSVRNELGQSTWTLRYCFKSPGPAQHIQWVQEALNETWNRLGVVMLQYDGSCSESRVDKRGHYPLEVSFWNGAGYSHYSSGRENGVFLENSFNSSNKPECTVSSQALERCVKKITVHEFGHALGLQHEQYRPDTPARFNGTRCLESLKASEAARNSFLPEQLLIGPWDKDSVMNYCSPGYFNFSIYQPLSAGDRAAVISAYGGVAYFDQDCISSDYVIKNDRGYHVKDRPPSKACKTAAQRYCEAVFAGTQNVFGIIRSIWPYSGLDVTCFKADFVADAPDSNPRENEQESEEYQSKLKHICEHQAKGPPEQEGNRKGYVGMLVDIGGTEQHNVACKQPIWRGSLNESEWTLAFEEFSDHRCRGELLWKELHLMEAAAFHQRNLLSCIASVDHFCDKHENGAAGMIVNVNRDQNTTVLEIACFRPLLKIELLFNNGQF